MSKFPNIKQPPDSNMCGAYSLVAALEYLDCFSSKSNVTINKLNTISETFTGESYSVRSDMPAVERASLFYNVTGVIPESNIAQYEYAHNALNSLVAMAYIGRKYGLGVSIFIRDEVTKAQLEKLYPQELRLAEATGLDVVLDGLCVANNDREIVIPTIVVATGQNHNVALDHQNYCFDPATGLTDKINPSVMGGYWLGAALRLVRY